MGEDKKNNELNEDLEIVIGDNTNLEISEAKDCVNSLRPKDKKNMKDKIIVPKIKEEKEEKK